MNEVVRYRRILLLTQGHLGVFTSKTAVVLLRYRAADVVGIVDSAFAGRRLADLVPGVPDRPIFSDVSEAAGLTPDAAFVCIHPAGGVLPADFRGQISAALDAGLDVVSGLHTWLSEDEEFNRRAAAVGARLIDLRKPPAERWVASGLATGTRCRRVLTVGTDCNVGKMVAALALTQSARRRGLDARFVATGQTGMMVAGKGTAIDAVVSDFAAGAVERLVLDEGDSDVCFVEGQGSIGHPGFSGVTLSIMHGCCPDAMILVHHAGRTHYRIRDGGPLPPLRATWEAYEQLAGLVHPAKIVGVALNAHGADDAVAEAERKSIAEQFGVPVLDPLHEDCGPLLDAVLG